MSDTAVPNAGNSDATAAADAMAATLAGGDERLAYRGVFQRLFVRPEIGAIVGAAAIWAFFWAVSREFGTAGGMSSILDVSATLGIMAVAVSLLMIGGEFDLSSGAATGTFAIITILLVKDVGDLGGAGLSLWVAIPLSLLFALALGWINGTMVERTGLPSFIVTLATFFILRGFKLGFSKLIIDNLTVGRISEAEGRGYEFWEPIFATVWIRNEHQLESRDAIYTIGIIGRPRPLGVAVAELNFAHRDKLNPGGPSNLWCWRRWCHRWHLVHAQLRWRVRQYHRRRHHWRCGSGRIPRLLHVAIRASGPWRLAARWLGTHVPRPRRRRFGYGDGFRRGIRCRIARTGSRSRRCAPLAICDRRWRLCRLRGVPKERWRQQYPVANIRQHRQHRRGISLLGLRVHVHDHRAGPARDPLWCDIARRARSTGNGSEQSRPQHADDSWTGTYGLLRGSCCPRVLHPESVDIGEVPLRAVLGSSCHGSGHLRLGGLLDAVLAASIPGGQSRQLRNAHREDRRRRNGRRHCDQVVVHDGGRNRGEYPTRRFPNQHLVVPRLLTLRHLVARSDKVRSWIFAVGGNKQAARQVGVPAARTKTQLFMIVSVAAWLVGLLLAFRLDTVQSVAGNGLEFEYIIAAVVGGTLLTGGYGSAFGAAIGAIIVAMTKQGIPSARWNSDWRFAFLGIILLTAVIANNFIKTKAEESR